MAGQRDKESTKKQLIDAGIELLERKGFQALGINAVAQRAQVSKVLIYRYFGGMQGLIRAIAEQLAQRNYRWIDPDQAFKGDEGSVQQFAGNVFQSMHQVLQDDEVSKRIMVLELSQENDITRAIAESRETAGLEITEKVRQLFADNAQQPAPSSDLDLEAVFAVASAAISYLTLRSSHVEMYNGVNIRSPQGWQRISSALASMLAASSAK